MNHGHVTQLLVHGGNVSTVSKDLAERHQHLVARDTHVGEARKAIIQRVKPGFRANIAQLAAGQRLVIVKGAQLEIDEYGASRKCQN